MTGSSYLTTASCIVFVGNIPYGLSETQITDIFSSVGRVVCFRMVFDRDTGRSKGYGFAEYIDAETAASAVRNLDNYEIMGRKLRVDYSSQGYVGKELGFSKEGLFPQPGAVHAKLDGYIPKNDQAYGDGGTTTTTFSENGYLSIVSGSENGHSGHSGRYEVPISASGTSAGMLKGIINVNQNHANANHRNVNNTGANTLLPKIPSGIENHIGLTTPDSISKTLSAIPVSQLLRTLIQVKELAATDPAKATELLRQCPQLSYALFQSLIMMNLVEPSVLAQLLEPTTTASMYNQTHTAMTAHLQTAARQPTPIGAAHTITTAAMSSRHLSNIPHQAAPTLTHTPQLTPAQSPFYGYPIAGVHTHTHPHSGQEQFAAQAAHHQQQQQARIQAMQEPEKAVLLQRVMVLSQEEIGRLPAEQQQQVLLLKHRLMTEGIGSAQAGY